MGLWLNVNGFSLVPDYGLSNWNKIIYEFTSKNPTLTYIDDDKNEWTPDRHYFTDMGSIPKWLQFLIAKDRFLGFYLHDSGYKFCGLYKNGKFVYLSRKDIDELLYKMCLDDPIKPWNSTAYVVYKAVREFGAYSYGRNFENKYK